MRAAARSLPGSDSAPAGTIASREVAVGSRGAFGTTLPSAFTGGGALEVVGICAVGNPLSGETPPRSCGFEPLGSAEPEGAAGFAPGSAAGSATLRLGIADVILGVASGVPVGEVLITVPGAVPETPLVELAPDAALVGAGLVVADVPVGPALVAAPVLALAPALVPAAAAPPLPPPLCPNAPTSPAPPHNAALMIRNFVFMSVSFLW